MLQKENCTCSRANFLSHFQRNCPVEIDASLLATWRATLLGRVGERWWWWGRGYNLMDVKCCKVNNSIIHLSLPQSSVMSWCGELNITWWSRFPFLPPSISKHSALCTSQLRADEPGVVLPREASSGRLLAGAEKNRGAPTPRSRQTKTAN